MKYYHKEITKAEYTKMKTQTEEEIFGIAICWGYGLYGFRLTEGNPETGEGYAMDYAIGDTCD